MILQLDAEIVVLQEADARFGEREGLLDLDYLHVMGGYRSIFNPDCDSRSHGWHGNVVLYRNGAVNHVHQLRLPGLEPRGRSSWTLASEERPFACLRCILVC